MSQCAKISYETIGEANIAVRKLANKRTLTVYKCKFCKSYHLTSQIRENAKPIEEKVEIYNKNLRNEISFNNLLIQQLNKDIDNKIEQINLLKRELKIQKDKFKFRSILEDEFFKNKEELFEEWRQLNIDNPFLTEEDFI